MSKAPERFVSLDLLRGLAAVMVLGGHLRSYLFQSYADLQSAGLAVGLLSHIFYLVTGLGHQAVVVFFALSGFLVGGKALGDILGQAFSWPRYLLRRLTRLWTVIVPALVLTLVLDRIGLALTSGRGYDGRYYGVVYPSGPHAGGLDLSLQALAGNLAFLQTIAVPVFGSNDPLWSLANELWYYVLFPLAGWLLLARASYTAKAIGVIALIGLLASLPVSLLEGGVVWVAGAIAGRCAHLAKLSTHLETLAARVAVIVLLPAALLISKLPFASGGDAVLGIAVACTLPVLAHLPSPGRWYTAVARASSELSYTLYLTHFPLLTLLVMTGIAPTRWPPGPAVATAYVVLLVVALAWAGVAWWCFERNTDRVHSWLSKILVRASGTVRRADTRDRVGLATADDRSVKPDGH